MTHDVECYAGSTYPEQPRALTWEGQHFQVHSILKRWREPDSVGFLVRCSPENRVFKLTYNSLEVSWQINPDEIIPKGD